MSVYYEDGTFRFSIDILGGYHQSSDYESIKNYINKKEVKLNDSRNSNKM